MCHKIGRPPISTIGLGRIEVSSTNRVPSPPARMTAFISFPFPLPFIHTVSCPRCPRNRSTNSVSRYLHLHGAITKEHLLSSHLCQANHLSLFRGRW